MTDLGKVRNLIQMPKVTRVEVIDSEGRAFTRYYEVAGVEVHLQDDLRTLKVFAGTPSEKWRDVPDFEGAYEVSNRGSMSVNERRSGLWRFIWRHRLAGHTIHKGYGLLTPATAYLCEECDLKWTRYHL